MHGMAKDAPFHGWKYMYKIRMRTGGPNMNNVCIEVFFNPDGKLHWVVPNHIAGFSEIGPAGGPDAEPSAADVTLNVNPHLQNDGTV
jgi:hypothetical protein